MSVSSSEVLPLGWLDVLPPQAECLREYQREQIATISRAMRRGYRRILAQAPTGAGKTHIMASIVLAAASAGMRVLILATRTRLVRQIHERLEAFDVRHGVIAASLPELVNHSATVQVASVDTLHRRALASETMPLPPADCVLFDEAHLATAQTRLQILQSYPGAVCIGFTATPAKKSGRSLSAAFDCLIPGPSIRELTATGVLVPTRIFNTPVVTQEELKVLPKDNDNDFANASLGELLRRPKLVGDVVSNWLRIAAGKRTLCFAVNKAHATALLESFSRQGVPVELLTDQDDETTREEVIARLEAGVTQVVINCFLLSYGVDVPAVECIVLARPTRSLAMYLQMVGRGLRSASGKSHCIVIDHGHVVESLGLPQSDFGWTLTPDRNVNTEALKARSRNGSAEQPRTCKECEAMWLVSEQGHACPSCGWVPAPRAKAVAVQDADLEELADAADVVSPHHPQVIQFYREACGWYARRWPDRWGSKPKSGRWWAWVQTQEKFRISSFMSMPAAYWQAAPVTVSAEVSGWLQHRLIKWARSKARAA